MIFSDKKADHCRQRETLKSMIEEVTFFACRNNLWEMTCQAKSMREHLLQSTSSHFLIQPVGDVWGGDWRNNSNFFPLTRLAPWEAVSWKFFGLLTISTTILHQFNPGLFLLVQMFPLLLYYIELNSEDRGLYVGQ